MLVALNLPFIVIGLATMLVSGWSYYNGRRFAGRERRRAPGRVMGDAVALHFGVQPADLARWQSARRLRVRHDARGLVVGVETDLGVDKVDRRPADHADPLPWIEGLVVARDQVRNRVSPRTQIAAHAIAPSASRVFDSDIDLESLFDGVASAQGPQDDAVVAGEVPREERKATRRGSAPAPVFDPAVLADLGLFDMETKKDAVSDKSDQSDQSERDESEPSPTVFQHDGRMYYI